MDVIFQENKTVQWPGGDTINYQQANLAVQTMTKKYCTPPDPHPPTPFIQSSSSVSQPKKKPSQPTPMVAQLTLSKNPHQTQPPNHYSPSIVFARNSGEQHQGSKAPRIC